MSIQDWGGWYCDSNDWLLLLATIRTTTWDHFMIIWYPWQAALLLQGLLPHVTDWLPNLFSHSVSGYKLGMEAIYITPSVILTSSCSSSMLSFPFCWLDSEHSKALGITEQEKWKELEFQNDCKRELQAEHIFELWRAISPKFWHKLIQKPKKQPYLLCSTILSWPHRRSHEEYSKGNTDYWQTYICCLCGKKFVLFYQ